MLSFEVRSFPVAISNFNVAVLKPPKCVPYPSWMLLLPIYIFNAVRSYHVTILVYCFHMPRPGSTVYQDEIVLPRSRVGGGGRGAVHERVSAETGCLHDADGFIYIFGAFVSLSFSAPQLSRDVPAHAGFRRGQRGNKEVPCIFVFLLHDDLVTIVI